MDNKNFDKQYTNQFDDNNEENKENLSSNDSDFLDLNSLFQTDAQDSDEVNKTAAQAEDKKLKDKKELKAKILKISLITFLSLVIVGCLAVGGIIFYLFTFVDGTMDENLNDLRLNYTTTIFVKNDSNKWEEYQRLHGGDNRLWIEYNEDKAKAEDPEYKGIPQNLADAFVAVEDKRFNSHYGVDWRRTASALLGVVTSGGSTSGHGGSSITQQLVRNLTDDRDRAITRKVREIMRARYLETQYTKDVILECYMNTIPMGNGIYGVEVASEYYFGKSVSELTLAECASIARITNLPEYYRPDTKPENNLKGRNLVLSLMLEQGYITEEEYQEAIEEELAVVADKSVIKEVEINNYFVDALIDDVIDALMEKYGYTEEHASQNFYNGGYKIYATLNPKIQAAIDSVYTDTNYILTGKSGAKLQGSMVVMDYKGNVLGIAGGMGEKSENRGLNRATMSPRQPGSTIKPLSAYAPAIEKDLITYSSIVNDTNTTYKKWKPTNWYGSYWGNMTVKRALENSVNTIPVSLVDQLSLQASYNFLTKDLGFKNLTQFDVDYSPLGMGGTNGGFTTKESAAAFAIFGNGGKYYEPITFTEIYDQHGELIITNESTPHVAISEDTATIMNHLLQNVVYGPEGTGRAAASFISNMNIYAKTGTSNDNYNIWFVGGSPYYVASSWCGYDQQEKISKASQARTMWGAVMKKIHSGLEPKQFKDSEFVQYKLYCATTGQLAKTGCPIGGHGWYKLTNQKYCTEHAGNSISGTTVSDANKYLEELNSSSQQDTSSEETSSNEPSSDSSTGAEPTD